MRLLSFDLQAFAFLRAVAVAIVVLASAHVAQAHGFRIDIDGQNKLVLYSDDSAAAGRSFYSVQALLGPAAFRSADHPGYDVDTFNGPSGFSSGESISFQTLGPLWYSNGGAPAHSPAGVNLVVTSQDPTIPGAVTVSGTSGFQNGFLIGQFDGVALGAYEHQLNYEIDVPGGVPIGAYALALRLTGTNAANQPFSASDPFVAVFNNGVPIGAFPGVANQLYASALAVPEPNTGLLAIVGFSAAAMLRLVAGRRCGQKPAQAAGAAHQGLLSEA